MNTIRTISEVQQSIQGTLLENVYFVQHNIPILIENSKNIEYEIKRSMSALGICVTVSTPSLSYKGDVSQTEPYWEINGLNVVVVESPTLNRGKANYATALDTALQVANTLNLIPNVCINEINQNSQNGLIIVNVSVKTNIGFRFEINDLNIKEEEDSSDDSEIENVPTDGISTEE